ncbi:MAG: PAS domain S-box protein [Azonexus sp.]
MDNPAHFFLKSPGYLRYLLAAVIMLLMLGIRLAVLPAEQDLPYLTFYPGIVITMLLCGLGPGLAYTVVAAGLATYVLFPPYWTFKLHPPVLVGSATFIVFGGLILWIMHIFQRRTDEQKRLLLKEIAERRRLENVSAESAAKLSSIINSAMDAIISVDARQQILLFNPAAELIFGYPANEIIGQSIERLMPERFRQRHAEHFRSFGQNGHINRKITSQDALLGLRRDGSEFPFEASISACVIAEEPIHTIILRDISERLCAEQALTRSRRQLATLIEQAPVSIAMFDREMNYLATSRRWLNEYGQQLDDLTGLNHYQVHTDISEAWKQAHRAGLAGITSSKERDIWIRADGSRQWIRWAVHPWSDETGEVGGIIISGENISHHVLTEMALRASEDDLVRAQAVGNIGSWRLDVRRNELTWSAENYRIFGLPEGTPLSYETFLSRVHPGDREYVDQMWQGALAGRNYSIEHRLLVDGKVKWVSEKAELEFDAQGKLIGGFGITQDITRRQLIKNQLKEANNRIAAIAEEQAIHLHELSGELTLAEQRERDRLYELLHDHVQPLLVAARMSLSGLNERTTQEDLLRATSKAYEHISKVIQTARSLSVELNPPLVRERGLVPGLESLCRWVQANHGLEVTMSSTPDTEPASMTIRLLCFKVVRELLMNVVKYAGTNQAVLTLEHGPDETLHIKLTDNGAGFDQNAQHAGSGLASIEQRLAMVGGRLLIESTPGMGTSASIVAPLGLVSDRRRPSSPRTAHEDDQYLPNSIDDPRPTDPIESSAS